VNRKILIVGAGIGGLTAALALQRRGFEVEVYEQADHLGDIGAGLQLSPNAVKVLGALGLSAGLDAIGVEPEGKTIRLWNSGETWPLFDLGGVSRDRYGAPYLMIHRGDLQGLLVDAVRRQHPDAIRLGARFDAMEPSDDTVTLHFEDGRRATGSLGVGADGVHSRLRSVLFGSDKPAFTGCMAWRGVIPAARLSPHLRDPIGTNWVGPGRHVIQYPLRRGELVNFVGVVERDDWTVETWTARGTREECAQDFDGWHADVQELIGNLDRPFKWALLGREPMTRWSSGRATLLGDACHPMLPFMAQGAAMAIEDGIVLARCLAADTDLAAALARYENARIDRTTRVVRAAARNRDLFHDSRLADALDAQRYVDRNWAEDQVKARYEWLFAYDPVDGPI